MISNKLRTIRQRLRKYSCQLMLLHTSKALWLSLGENCLTDSILQRYGIKSFSTLYSHGRSNIDYALFLEKNDYKDILNIENLRYDNIGKDKVVRSTLANSCDAIFSELHMNGFEFTHHNVIDSEKDKESAKRKIQRMLAIRGTEDVVFFYHHRINPNSDFDSLFNKALELSKYYRLNGRMCHIIIFFQRIITEDTNRGIHYRTVLPGIHSFELCTKEIWGGNNPNILWATVDDDLIYKMVKTSVKLIKRGYKISDRAID